MLDEEQAINYIGKTVYVVDYHTDEILPKVVKSVREVSNFKEYQCRLLDHNNKELITFYDTWEQAHDSLIYYCEMLVDQQMLRLNGVMEMREL